MWTGIIAWHVLWSVAAFVAFGLDKRAAVRSTRRTPERTLLWLSFLGGWPGAVLAMRMFRHKRSKRAFIRAFSIAAAANLLAVGAAVLLLPRF